MSAARDSTADVARVCGGQVFEQMQPVITTSELNLEVCAQASSARHSACGNTRQSRQRVVLSGWPGCNCWSSVSAECLDGVHVRNGATVPKLSDTAAIASHQLDSLLYVR